MSEYKFLSHLKQVKANIVGMKRKEEDINRNNLQYQIAIDHGLKSDRGEQNGDLGASFLGVQVLTENQQSKSAMFNSSAAETEPLYHEGIISSLRSDSNLEPHVKRKPLPVQAVWFQQSIFRMAEDLDFSLQDVSLLIKEQERKGQRESRFRG